MSGTNIIRPTTSKDSSSLRPIFLTVVVVRTTLPRKSCKDTKFVIFFILELVGLSYHLQFNIFYPDLIDKTKAPTYKIVKEDGNDDTVLLHFSAGPPYEDIAFRIVNREWEFSHKR